MGACFFTRENIQKMRNKNVLYKPTYDSYSLNLEKDESSSFFNTFHHMLAKLKIGLANKSFLNLSFIEKKEIKTKFLHIINFLLQEIDKVLGSQLEDIIGHSRFQRLEGTWRGMKYLVDQSSKCSEVKIRLLDVSWDVLSNDVAHALEFDQSQMFKKVYEEEFGTAGGEPYGLLIGDYYLTLTDGSGKGKNDLEALRLISNIAAASFTPFVTSISPHFFGIENFADLQSLRNIKNIFKHHEYTTWKYFREAEDSRFIGLVVPNILMRKPYKLSAEFFFAKDAVETNGPYHQAQYLWGNVCYSFAAIAMRAFSESGWFFFMRGFTKDNLGRGMTEGVCKAEYEVEQEELIFKPFLNSLITFRLARELEEEGFLTLCAQRNLPIATFFNCPSVQKLKADGSTSAIHNAKLSAMLNNILSLSRFSHYIKVLIRDKLGQFTSPEEVEDHLQRWLLKYTAASDTLTPELLIKYPLKAFNLKVSEIKGEPGQYTCIVHLQPQSQIERIETKLSINFNIA